jgi:hypothetical protein
MSSLTTKEESCLELFMQRLRELLESSVVKNPPPAVFTMSETVFGDSPKTEVIFDGYKEEAFLAFFTTFRQFTMEKEQAVYFDKVCQIVLDKCDRAELKDWTNYAKARWDRILDSGPVVGFEHEGKLLTNRKLLKLWLYSGRFHTDIDKADWWNTLPQMIRSDVELSVQAMIPSFVNCLVMVGSVIRYWWEATTEPVPPVPTK